MTQKITPLCEQVGQFFSQNKKEKDSLLPQRLEEKLLAKLSHEGQAFISGESYDKQCFEMIVGLFLANEKGLFEASKEDLLSATKAYALSVVTEQMRRSKLVTIEKEFHLDDILNYQTERHIKLTDFGRQSVSKM